MRYRKSDDREQLLYYHELGLEALEKTEKAINQRQSSAQFTYYWGMLTACHGYVMCAALANANDLSSERAGAAGRAATNLDMHKIWFSHYCLRLKDDKKLSRRQIEDAMVRLINAIIDGDKPQCQGLDVAWFEKFLNLEKDKMRNENYGSLTKAFRQNLSFNKMRELIQLETPDLPPLDLEVPNP